MRIRIADQTSHLGASFLSCVHISSLPSSCQSSSAVVTLLILTRSDPRGLVAYALLPLFSPRYRLYKRYLLLIFLRFLHCIDELGCYIATSKDSSFKYPRLYVRVFCTGITLCGLRCIHEAAVYKRIAYAAYPSKRMGATNSGRKSTGFYWKIFLTCMNGWRVLASRKRSAKIAVRIHRNEDTLRLSCTV